MSSQPGIIKNGSSGCRIEFDQDSCITIGPLMAPRANQTTRDEPRHASAGAASFFRSRVMTSSRFTLPLTTIGRALACYPRSAASYLKADG
jgi:hypothetical protein